MKKYHHCQFEGFASGLVIGCRQPEQCNPNSQGGNSAVDDFDHEAFMEREEGSVKEKPQQVAPDLSGS